ncbi:polysaccharide biosynthesis C-terminal domain-containing protein [Arthrobacter sp.]|uniref:lipopolysaccharide biosynthesis protein n=1 Tax=Arthrobacter sp. TaxID=1667 RepID=UPI002811A002|nr:polysaccharide biosynthesis C-terminal domain-containing protein [Arthrobacter sp.]
MPVLVGSEAANTEAVDAQLSHIARSGVFNLLGAAVSAVFGFGLIVVVTQLYDQATAGMFFAASSAFLILLGAASLGTESGLARFMLRYEATGRTADISQCLSVALRPVLLTSLVLALGTALLAGQLAPLIGLDTPQGSLVLLMFALLLPVAAWGDFSLAGARSFGTVRSTVLIDKFLRTMLQPLSVWLAALAGGGVLLLSAGWVAPYAIAGVVSVLIFRRMLRRRGIDHHTAPLNDRAMVRREFWGFTWPRGIARLCQILLQRSDIILIAALLSVQDAALYTAATRFVALGQFATQAIQQVLQPRFSQLLAKGRHADAADVFRISTAWSMAVAWPLYMVTGAAGGFYLMIFGAGYNVESAGAVVILMSIAMLAGVAAGPLDTLLLMAGGSRTSLWIALTTLAADIGLCLILIPLWGIVGAAVAWGIAVLLKNLLTLERVKKLLAMDPFGWRSALVAVANVACLGIPLLTLSLLQRTHLGEFFGVLAAGCAAYAFLLWLWRGKLRLPTLKTILSRKDSPSPERNEI